MIDFFIRENSFKLVVQNNEVERIVSFTDLI